MKRFNLRYASTNLYFGIGAIKELKKYVKKFNHVTIVTGKKSAKASGALDDVVDILKMNNIEFDIFDHIKPNPTVEIADDLAEKISGNTSECIIAIGGGSVIDTAKVSSIIVLSGGSAVDYLNGKNIKDYLPLFIVNLTHGTGSEIDRYAVLTKGVYKIGISARYPDVSIDDPRYTLTLPKNQSVYTSIDAFFHAYEAVTSKFTNPFVETLAKDCVRIIAKHISGKYSLEDRYHLLYASMIAGISLDMSPSHVVHAIEHALSGINPDLSHGCGLAIVGSRSIYWIHKYSENSREILECFTNRKIKSPRDAENAYREILQSAGFNETLSDYGFGRDDFKNVERILFDKLKYFLRRIDFNFTPEILWDILESSL